MECRPELKRRDYKKQEYKKEEEEGGGGGGQTSQFSFTPVFSEQRQDLNVLDVLKRPGLP
ncbi:hypothetical protein N7509_000936 [Penicillium cosmopolitanum]|uniref:Uncharacterized protein n=1 Tax=Penicillium cosmopolitanum TaxID=1131564 RepID=A0A9W9WB66_9EURO|nr:uncharacterized protein N7509_000936 [Penicillium cosmopolitanum]KAJ5414309.1 hypothetical protein N7509_000936 [Penicillium cosmopolitanum]